MTSSSRHMHLGLALDVRGCHRASLRHPDVAQTHMTDFGIHCGIAQRAEQGLFDLVFMPDVLAVSWGSESSETFGRQPPYRPLGPAVVASPLAALTREIGLVVSINTTYNVSYTSARMLASLDHISAGRAGRNLVTGTDPEEAPNVSDRPHHPAAERYERATHDDVKGRMTRYGRARDEMCVLPDVASLCRNDTGGGPAEACRDGRKLRHRL